MICLKKKIKIYWLCLRMGWTSILPYWHTIEGEEGFCFISRITDLAMRHHLPCGIDFVNKLVRKFYFVIPFGVARTAHYFITDRSKLRPMLWVISAQNFLCTGILFLCRTRLELELVTHIRLIRRSNSNSFCFDISFEYF